MFVKKSKKSDFTNEEELQKYLLMKKKSNKKYYEKNIKLYRDYYQKNKEKSLNNDKFRYEAKKWLKNFDPSIFE